jgi:1-acyl-sn-glycerol-3-phosphate acyltransferase
MTQSDTQKSGGIGDILFGIYALLSFVVFLVPAILFALVLPGLERRRRWAGACARAPFHLTRTRVRIRGLELLPDTHCVVVANHASYIDGVLLFAFMPPRFSYVIKGEVRHLPVIGLFLKRIGAHFVERFDASGSARDARYLLKAARSGESLAFFPEGTFQPHPGLDRFRSGAFAAALKGTMPVIPVVISGSRQVLPGGHALPRRGDLRVDILQPIEPGSDDYDNSRQLAKLSRQRILEVLDEPDLLA